MKYIDILKFTISFHSEIFSDDHPGRSFIILPNIDLTGQPHSDVVAIWLDDTIGISADNQWFNVVKQLRQIISNVEVFNEVHKCIEYISATGIQRIFLVVAGNYGDDFDIELFEEIIHNVSIYSLSSNNFESVSQTQGNIRSFFNDAEMLIDRIHADYGIFIANREISVNSFQVNTTINTTRCITPQVIQWKCRQIMSDMFRQIPCAHHQSMERFLQLCKLRYEDNQYQLKQIDDFEQTYRPDMAINWYTRGCFLFRVLNKSMQTDDIDSIMASSSILMNIYNQLEVSSMQRNQENLSSRRVYHGRLMSVDELRSFQLNIGGFVSNKSFLSPSFNRKVAEMFADIGSQTNEQHVLYEISMDWDSLYSKPVASVRHLSQYPVEEEVLFTNGHIFRIDSCEIIHENTWLIQLTLCNQWHTAVQNISDYFDVAILQLLEILPQISPKTNEANDRMLQWCRLYYANNPLEQSKIQQFEDSYRSDSAVRWYTKDSFLYRLLNTALREDNIDMIIDFRYFIIDLYEQLTKSHLDYVTSCQQRHLTVYRGQKISLMELNRLTDGIGKYISVKSMFSASLSETVAQVFAELSEFDRRQSLQSILFQIDIDLEKLTKSGKNHIFANIIHMSCIAGEKEVLFMANTQFRVISVTPRVESSWLVRLTLLDHTDEDNTDMHVMNRYLRHITNMITENYRDADGIRSFFQSIRRRQN